MHGIDTCMHMLSFLELTLGFIQFVVILIKESRRL